MSKVILTSLVAAMVAVSVPTYANDGDIRVDASVSASNMYLWRGTDLGKGDAHIAADLSVGMSGFYAGTWVASGDAALGTEIDLYVGFGGEIDQLSYDVNYTTYAYPSSDIDAGDAAEIIASLGYGPMSVSAYWDVSGEETSFYPNKDDAGNLNYIAASAEFGQFGVLLGMHNKDSYGEGMIHADLSYAYNDNLSFTLSLPLSKDEDDGKSKLDSDPLIAATLSLPLEL